MAKSQEEEMQAGEQARLKDICLKMAGMMSVRQKGKSGRGKGNDAEGRRHGQGETGRRLFPEAWQKQAIRNRQDRDRIRAGNGGSGRGASPGRGRRHKGLFGVRKWHFSLSCTLESVLRGVCEACQTYSGRFFIRL